MAKAKAVKQKQTKPSGKRAVQNILAALKQRDGRLIAAKVLEEAKTNPILRRYFTWDDTLAAARWRLHQAKLLIKDYELKIIVANEPPQKMKAWVHLSRDKEGYRHITDVVKSTSLRRSYAKDLEVELRGIANRLRVLNEPSLYGQIIKAIDTLLKRK